MVSFLLSNEIELRERIEIMDKIANLWITGTRNPGTIAKQLKMSRAEVLEYIEEYKAIIRDDDEVKARAKEALYEADSALHLVNEENWGIVKVEMDNKVKATVLKNIADIEAKRVELLQKAGLYDDAALGDELAAMEEKQQILIGIIKEVTSHCPSCKIEVARRLAKVTGQPSPVVIDVEALPPSP